MNKHVKILKTPITERYCRVGDVAMIDITNNQIRCGGAWFSYDDRWNIEFITKDERE